jgi:hypothetical protein
MVKNRFLTSDRCWCNRPAQTGAGGIWAALRAVPSPIPISFAIDAHERFCARREAIWEASNNQTRNEKNDSRAAVRYRTQRGLGEVETKTVTKDSVWRERRSDCFAPATGHL